MLSVKNTDEFMKGEFIEYTFNITFTDDILQQTHQNAISLHINLFDNVQTDFKI